MPLFHFRFSDFETESNFDTVQILGGGRTKETAVNIATLSGNLEDIRDQTFVSASNFMIIKFMKFETNIWSQIHSRLLARVAISMAVYSILPLSIIWTALKFD